MRRALHILLLSAVTLTFPAFAQDAATGLFHRSPCPYPIPEELRALGPIETGYLTVPASHFDSGAQDSMRLPLVKLPSLGDGAGGPIVLLSGGPGESTLSSFIPGMVQPQVRDFRRHHDIILIELRGLRYAEPSLVCPEVAEARKQSLAVVSPFGESNLKDQLEAFSKARTRFETEGIDLTLFTFPEMAADVIMAVEALGYDEFNLYGNSAGTILVQHIMREYPERLRSVVMGSTIPATVNPRTANPAVAERAFKQLFDNVASDADSAKAFPNLEQKWRDLIRGFNERPVTLAIPDPITGDRTTIAFSGDRLIELFYSMLLLDANGAAPIPFLIESLISGDYSLLENFGALLLPPPDFSWGVQLSAMLAEYPPEAKIESAGLYPEVERVMRYWRFGPIPLEQAREIWPVPARQVSKAQPVNAAIPTLLLSGELDPATPPEYAETIGEELPSAYTVLLPGVGHGPLDSGPCSFRLVNSFLDDPSRPLDTSCVAGMRARFYVEPLTSRLLLPAPPTSHLAALMLSALMMMSVVPVSLFSIIRKHKRFAGGFIVGAAWLNAVFVIVFAVSLVLADSPLELLYDFPASLRVAQSLPLISALLIAGALTRIPVLWKLQGWTSRVYSTLLVTGVLVFLWELYWWRILLPRI